MIITILYMNLREIVSSCVISITDQIFFRESLEKQLQYGLINWNFV